MFTRQNSTASGNPMANAFHNEGNKIAGENGELKLRTSSDTLVDMFTLVTSGTNIEEIFRRVNELMKELDYNSSNTDMVSQQIRDLFVMMFHKRQMREGGEGQKMVFYSMMLAIYDYYPNTICDIIKGKLIPHHGYYKDYFNLWSLVIDRYLDPNSSRYIVNEFEAYKRFNPLISAIVHDSIEQRRTDLTSLYKFCKAHGKNMSTLSVEEMSAFMDSKRDGDFPLPTLSLFGKYIPKEGRSMAKKLYWFIPKNYVCSTSVRKEMVVPYMIRLTLKSRNNFDEIVPFPSDKQVPFGARKQWRKENSLLGAALDVCEQKMCRNEFEKIVHSRVASIASRNYAKAYLNETTKGEVLPQFDDTGNRHPRNKDRIQCRQNVLENSMDLSNVNVAQDFPNTIAYKAFCAKSTAEKQLRYAYWDAYVEHVKTKMQDFREKLAGEFVGQQSDSIAKALSSGNWIGVADMSGSMTWDGKAPNRAYDIAIGLVALLSCTASPEWRDLAITFAEEPRIFSFKTKYGSMNIKERLDLMSQFVGYSTNIEATHREIIRVMQSGGMKDENMPVIVIVTDGEFDEMTGSNRNKTGHEKYMEMYATAGFTTMPTIVYWNAKPGRAGVQTSADHPGVQFLQGQSPGLFRYILYGETFEKTEVNVDVDGENVTMKTSSVTPYDTFRKAMDQDCYESLLMLLSNSKEGYLKDYTYIIDVD